jgi:hypothetical protein
MMFETFYALKSPSDPLLQRGENGGFLQMYG